jgi:HD-GYP domain-containing protein (c-di-GMP phosphodiesterase class II)
MLLRLPPKDVKLGMFIVSFEGNWADRPFWQSRFLLDDPADLRRLRESSIEAVVIDTQKSAPAPERAPRRTAPSRATDLDAGRAAKAVGRGKRTVIKLFDDIRLGRTIAVGRLAPIVAELAAEVDRNAQVILRLLRLKNRDEYTYVHSVAVSALMMNFARHLGLDETLMPEIGLAGLLHDVGKIAVPSDILNKPGQLTDGEFALMKEHPGNGYDLLRASKGVSQLALDVCLSHHERFDGTGYPSGLSGSALSLIARMGAICDVYDALTSDRAYKDAWTPQHALGAMRRWKGHFDPELLDAFMESLGIFPIGTLVRIRNSALGIVIGENPEEPTCPTVRSFYSITSGRQVRHEDVAIKAPGILALEHPDDWGFEDWGELAHEMLGCALPVSGEDE